MDQKCFISESDNPYSAEGANFLCASAVSRYKVRLLSWTCEIIYSTEEARGWGRGGGGRG